MDREVEKILVDILENGMSLSDQNIWIESQNRLIPETDDLFVIVGFSDAQVIANNNYFDSENCQEVQEVLQRENIQVDLISRDNSARQRRWEVLSSLKSIFSQQQQERYRFRIFKIPVSFVNTTEAEGSSQLNRFTIVIPCHVWYRKVLETDQFFNDFPIQTLVENAPESDIRIRGDQLVLQTEDGLPLETEDGEVLTT